MRAQAPALLLASLRFGLRRSRRAGASRAGEHRLQRRLAERAFAFRRLTSKPPAAEDPERLVHDQRVGRVKQSGELEVERFVLTGLEESGPQRYELTLADGTWCGWSVNAELEPYEGPVTRCYYSKPFVRRSSTSIAERAQRTIAAAMRSSGSTASAAPSAMAFFRHPEDDRGRLVLNHGAGPTPAEVEVSPFAPSEPMPVSTTPTARAPTSRAQESKSTSTEGRCRFTGGPEFSRATYFVADPSDLEVPISGRHQNMSRQDGIPVSGLAHFEHGARGRGRATSGAVKSAGRCWTMSTGGESRRKTCPGPRPALLRSRPSRRRWRPSGASSRYRVCRARGRPW